MCVFVMRVNVRDLESKRKPVRVSELTANVTNHGMRNKAAFA